MIIRPIYKKLLILAIVIYVIGTTAMISELYHIVGKIEHTLAHISEGHRH